MAYFKQGDFLRAETHLAKALQFFYDHKKFDFYSQALNSLLRIYAEREDFSAIQKEKERLQDLVVRENIELTSMNHYTLGLCSAYRDGQEPSAIEYFQKALELALKNDNKVDLSFALYGLAVTYYNLTQYDAALRELSNLQVVLSVVDVPDIQTSSELLMGSLNRNLQKFDVALEHYWQGYERLKVHPNLFLYIYALYGLGSTYKQMGESNLAKIYLELAYKAVNEKQFPRLIKRIRNLLVELGTPMGDETFDLVVDARNNSVTEKKIGSIEFKNQFILLDLLNLFVHNPGKVFSKETLVKRVWNQDYNPSVHDNKIYVTIKRLRRMIEPDFDKPKYIFRAKQGYYLNKDVRIRFPQ